MALAYSSCVQCTIWSVQRMLSHTSTFSTGVWSAATASPASIPRVFLISDDPSSVQLASQLPEGVLSSPFLDAEYMATLGATPFHIDMPSTVGLGVTNTTIAARLGPSWLPSFRQVSTSDAQAPIADRNLSLAAAITLLSASLHPAHLPGLAVAEDARRSVAAVTAGIATARAAFLGAFIELLALSACDVVVHSKSGFSKSAVEWGNLHPRNIRMLPRAPKAEDGFIPVLPGCGPGTYLALYYKLAW
jgi:hypothetical protein